ncbi:ribonuclease H protein, partial [Trifolium medium]|nr:ribonuclease H protein [Trifolium medium]
QPPILNWVKCNIDGSSLGNPGSASCGRLFRTCNATFLGAFAYNLGIANSLIAEINGAMFAIELGFQKGWLNLWLESDSIQACKHWPLFSFSYSVVSPSTCYQRGPG